MSEILTTDLTTATLDGEGVFDKLMDSVSLHINEEFAKQRLTGSEYSKVYLGGMQAVLAQATSFLLQKEQAGLQADLIKEQILLSQQAYAKGVVEIALLGKQVEKLTQDILLAQAQVGLISAQTINTQAELPRIEAEVIIGQRTGANLIPTGDQIRATVTKINADTLRTEEETTNAILTGKVIAKQESKVATETILLKQKVVTEQAQTADKVQTLDVSSGVFGTTTAIGGTSNKQQELYAKQKDGFDRDAEQKLMKIMVDHRNVVASITKNADSNASNLSTTSIAKVIEKAKEGIGAKGNLIVTELGGVDSYGNTLLYTRNVDLTPVGQPEPI